MKEIKTAIINHEGLYMNNSPQQDYHSEVADSFMLQEGAEAYPRDHYSYPLNAVSSQSPPPNGKIKT